MEAPSRNVGLKIILDFIFLITPFMIALIIAIFFDSFQRGFFCNDESLSLPYKENTISSGLNFMIFLLSAAIIIIFVELVQARKKVTTDQMLKLFNRNVPMVLQNLYKYIGTLLFAESVNQFFVEITKHSVGRLRPHFFEVCIPLMLDGSTCADEKNLHKYIEKYECTNNQFDNKFDLKNIWLSFPSGHAAVAFTVATYMSIYIQSRITWRRSKLLKHILQVIYFAAAAYVGFTRINDYAHHWSDVVGSALIGISIGVFAGVFVADLCKSKKS